MYVTVVIAEETRSKLKAFLTAPEGAFIHIGDMVKASNVNFRVLFVETYHQDDDTLCTALAVALGMPEKIQSVIREEEVRWDEE